MVSGELAFPPLEAYPTKTDFDRLYLPLGEDSTELSDFKLSRITYTQSQRGTGRQLTGMQLHFSSGDKSPMLTSEVARARDTTLHVIDLDPSRTIRYVDMLVL